MEDDPRALTLVFRHVDSIGIGVAAVEGLLKKTNLDPGKIDNIVWGNVVLQAPTASS